MNIEGWSTPGELPGSYFASAEAVSEFKREAAAYEAVVAQYASGDGDEAELYEALSALGYDDAEIEWHVKHRGQRMQQGYVKCGS